MNENKSLSQENKHKLETTVYDRNIKRKVSTISYIPIDHL